VGVSGWSHPQYDWSHTDIQYNHLAYLSKCWRRTWPSATAIHYSFKVESKEKPQLRAMLTTVNHTNINIQAMLVWLTLPINDFFVVFDPSPLTVCINCRFVHLSRHIRASGINSNCHQKYAKNDQNWRSLWSSIPVFGSYYVIFYSKYTKCSPFYPIMLC